MRRYRMGDAAVGHNTGDCILDRIRCQPGVHTPGHCVFGLNHRGSEPGRVTVRFEMQFSDIDAQANGLANLDIYDNTAERIVDSLWIGRDTVASNGDDFRMQTDVRPGQVLEFRVWWYGSCVLEVRQIEVEQAPVAL